MRNPQLSSLALALAWITGGSTADAAEDGAKIDFATSVKPIFKDRCYECHGADKQKGRLRLDQRASVFESDGGSGVVIPGDADGSLLVELLELDADDPDIMPASGDPLNDDQIALIRQWIEQGADWPASADEVDAPKVDDGLGPRELSDPETAAEAKAMDAIADRGGLAMRVAANTNVVDVNLSLLGDSITDDDLTLLAGLEPTLVWLNLARTAVTDAGLKTLSRFTELRRLNLSNTKVTDAGIAALSKLTHLEYLNLYGTEISDAGMAPLRDLQHLRRVYLWQTKVTADAATALAADIPDVLVDRGDYVLEEMPEADWQDTTFEIINKNCPFTDKPAVPEYVVEFQGVAIGFCCENCKLEFEKNPAANASKVAGFDEARKKAADGKAATGANEQAAAKPINDKCPVSGQPVRDGFVASFEGKTIGFCCNNCKAKFEADPKAFADKLGLREQAAAKPINTQCPVSGQPAKDSVVASFEGKTIGFCCNNCKAKFEADPKAFADKLGGKN